MKFSLPHHKLTLLVLPFLQMFIWFRYEQSFHSAPHVLLLWVLVSGCILFLLLRALSGKSGIVIQVLWTFIIALTLVDYFQQSYFHGFSGTAFLSKIGQCTDEVRERTVRLLNQSRNASRQLEDELQKVSPFSPEKSFIRLQDRFSGEDSWWGVYSQEGRLLCWHGQLPFRETYLQRGSEEVSIFNQMHQQFLKYKRAASIHDAFLYLVVLKPISADYGIQNRYLTRFNLLTDGLPIRPSLLYGSQPTVTSPDLIVRNFVVTPDFSISALYKKQQYGEFLKSRIFQLHWWLELSALIFFVFTLVYLFFEFLGISGREQNKRVLWVSWCALFLIAWLCANTLPRYSAFGSTAFFKPYAMETTGYGGVFRSPGSFFFASFLTINVIFSLVLLMKRIHPQIPWKNVWLRYFSICGSFLVTLILFLGYYDFVRNTLDLGSLDPIDISVRGMVLDRNSQIFGIMWLDLSFVLAVASFSALVMGNVKRDGRRFVMVSALQALALLLFIGLSQEKLSHPLVPLLVLYGGLGTAVFFLPHLWGWFQRINLLSQFFVVLLAVSLISFLFHFTRFHYAGDIQKSFVEHHAASEVVGQEKSVAEILRISQRQLDETVQNVFLDPKISDLAYRLWTRTNFATAGYKSALEIYDEDGKIVNRFSLGLPKLLINISQIAGGSGWQTAQRIATFGTFRRPVLIAARRIAGIGFLVVQASPDYENLPFLAATSPFQELFRPDKDDRLHVGPLYLYVYDPSWRPIFVSSPEISPPAQDARELLRDTNSIWVTQSWSDRMFHVYYFRIRDGFAALSFPVVTLRSHIVHLIDLLLFNLLWLSVLTIILITFFKPYLLLHFQSHAFTRFNFFQKLLFAFVVFSMIPMLLLSLLIRNYVWEKTIDEVTSRTLNSFSVATKVVSDYLFYRAGEAEPSTRGIPFSDELLEWIGQVIQQDVGFYYDRYLLAASNRELFSAGLLGGQISAETYVDLFVKGQKYSISDARIGKLRFLNVSGRIFTGRYKDEVITIPFLIDEKAVEAEITGLREYMILVGAGLILFAIFLGYFLANRFSQPVQVLIEGTGEMSRGNLQYRIRRSYRDEFQQLVESFNAMADSLYDQRGALERRRAYIENILNNITTAVISINSTIHVTTVNPAAVQMFEVDSGYSGLLGDLLAHAPGWEAVEEVIRSFLTDRERFQIQETALIRTNEEVHFRLVYVPLFEEGRWNGAVLLVEDISDIIRSNRLSTWADIARRVAHEVKNPLTPIQLAIEHLQRVYEDHSEDFEAVLQSCSDAVLRQVKVLRKLVSEFSQYGRPATLRRSEVDLEGFLNDLITNYQQHLPKEITMETRFGDRLPAIQMDADKIRSALMNIIENGLQAMNGLGKIAVEADRQQNGFVRIRIVDSGPGIPPELLPRLFEPYFSTKGGGTGLGLAIARKNIEDHGGKIQVESTPHRGTIVTVLLPCPQAPVSQMRETE